MNELFSQGGKGSTGILTNKQAIARKFGVKQNEVVYFAVGVDLGGYKVIYDKTTQRAYSLPVLPVGTTAVSLNEHAVLVHSAGTIDLGELAATRRDFVSLSDSFVTGLVVNTRNELIFHNGIGYTYLGSLPVTISTGINPVGNADWKPQTDPSLRDDLAKPGGAFLVGGVAAPITSFGDTSTGDDTSVFVAAEASSHDEIYLPEGNYYVYGLQLTKRYWGPGVIIQDSGYPIVFSGSGVNDLQLTGSYNGDHALSVKVRIRQTGSPDHIEYSLDNGSSWISTQDVYDSGTDQVTSQPIAIVSGGVNLFVTGIVLLFTSTSGHTSGDTWSFNLTSSRMLLDTKSGSITKNGSLIFSVSGNNDTNTIAGKDALGGATNVGANNTAYGWKCLYSNITGYANTASGLQSMENNKTGKNNCAYGADSLRANVSGSDNVAVGVFASGANTTGYGNTGLGNDANRYNETGFGNTAAGVQALYHNKAGNENTAFGEYALRGGNSSLPTGISIQYCVAVGAKAGFNALGNNNTAIGYEALYAASGTDNVGVGFDAGFKVTAGSFNVFLGSNSGNVLGQATDVTNCVLLGDNTKSTGNNAVAIGSGVTAAQNTVAIGNSSHTDIFQYGNIKPQIDNTFSIGSSSARYSQIYATNGTINTSDERLKTPLDFDLLDAEKRAAVEIKKHIGKFRWLDSDGSKIHFGVGAQTVEQILTKNGLNSNDYAFLVKENGTYGINYGELAMFILSTI